MAADPDLNFRFLRMIGPALDQAVIITFLLEVGDPEAVLSAGADGFELDPDFSFQAVFHLHYLEFLLAGQQVHRFFIRPRRRGKLDERSRFYFDVGPDFPEKGQAEMGLLGVVADHGSAL
jgi:hypothetical protein